MYFAESMRSVYRSELPWLLDVASALLIDTLAVLFLVFGTLSIDWSLHLSGWSEETLGAWEKVHFCLVVSLTALLTTLCAFDIVCAKILHVRRKRPGDLHANENVAVAP